MAGTTKNKNVDLTTGIGTIAFPRLTAQTAEKKEDGTLVYEVQFIIPKSQKDDIRALMKAVREVGEDKWGDRWKNPKVRNPLRDGDAEADELTEDGSTKGEKYPERLGCFFFNARTQKPVGLFDRQRNPISADAVYSGCRAKVAVQFYPYAKAGNQGIAVSLNGVQKIAEGEPLGNARPSVEAMFDVEDGDDFEDEYGEDEFEEDEAPAKPAKKKPGAKPAKKAAAKRAKRVEVDDEDDEDYDDDI